MATEITLENLSDEQKAKARACKSREDLIVNNLLAVNS